MPAQLTISFAAGRDSNSFERVVFLDSNYKTPAQRFTVSPSLLDEPISNNREARHIGTILFQNLFCDSESRTMFEGAFARIPSDDYGILIIHLPDTCASLREYPWELLSEDLNAHFLIDRSILVVISTGQQQNPSPVGTLAHTVVQVLHADAPGYAKLQWKKERDAIATAMPSATVTASEGLNPPKIQHPAQQLLHVISHGEVRRRPNGSDDATLVVARGWFTREYVTADTFEEWCREASGDGQVRLIVLNSCSSGFQNRDKISRFWNFPDLLLNNNRTHYAICNTRPVLDSLAVSFSREFYRYVGLGRTIARAMLEARKELKRQRTDLPDWSFPRLSGRPFVNAALVQTAPVLKSTNFKIARNAIEYYHLADAWQQTRALSNALTSNEDIREAFKQHISAELEADRVLVRDTLADPAASPGRITRLIRMLQSRQDRIMRILSFRSALSDNVARGGLGGLLGGAAAILCFQTFAWLVTSSPIAIPLSLLSKVYDLAGQAFVHTGQPIPLLHHYSTGPLLNFLIANAVDPHAVTLYTTSLATCFAAGIVFGLTRFAAFSLFGGKYLRAYAVLAGIIGSGVGYLCSLVPLPGSSIVTSVKMLRVSLLCGIIALYVALTVCLLKTPDRRHRVALSITSSVQVFVLAIVVLALSEAGSTPFPLLHVTYVTLMAFFLTFFYGYMLSRS